jgi:hypothetical protein
MLIDRAVSLDSLNRVRYRRGEHPFLSFVQFVLSLYCLALAWQGSDVSDMEQKLSRYLGQLERIRPANRSK